MSSIDMLENVLIEMLIDDDKFDLCVADLEDKQATNTRENYHELCFD